MNNRTTEDIVDQIKQLNQEIKNDQNSNYADLHIIRNAVARLTESHNQIHELLNKTQCDDDDDRELVRLLTTTHELQKPVIINLRQINYTALKITEIITRSNETWTELLELIKQINP